MQLEKVFLGNLQSDQRKYLKYAVEELEKVRPRKYYVPCVGQFAIPRVLVEAGVKPENIVTSDISIFSSVLGYYLMGKPISELDIEWADEATKELCLGQESEAHNAATIFYLLKIGQLREGIMYEAMFLKNLIVKKKQHMERVVASLQEMKKRFEGMTYEVRDLRAYTNNPDLTENDVVIMNPPVFGKGYEKMFDSDYMYMRDKVAEFDWKKEYHELYINAKESKALFIIYRSHNSNGIDPQDIYFAKNLKVSKTDYWVLTQQLPLKRVLKNRRHIEIRPYRNLAIMKNDDEITEKTTVQFIKVKEEHALYYRDLFAHRLGDTKSEVYYIVLLDGKVFSTVAFHMRDLLTLKSDKAFESFGFSVPSKRYPKINRLLMLLITCKDIVPVLAGSVSGSNRFYNLKGIKTTCLSKYRKLKLNNGILNVVRTEKMPNDLYKILYETEFYDRTFADCIKIFLEESTIAGSSNGRTPHSREEILGSSPVPAANISSPQAA